MQMLGTGGGSTQLPVQGYFDHQQSGGFGPGFQNRSPEEVVKHDQRPDHKPPRRGCGCAALPLVASAIAVPFLSRLSAALHDGHADHRGVG
jgi:hypothetical protein